jgi:hypothetical protein
MDKGIILTTFNKQFLEFIEDVHKAFPDDLEIATCKESLITIKKTNPRLLIIIVKNYLSKYKNEIMNENIEFFINNDYRNDIEQNSLSERNTNIILDKINQLRKSIKLMNDDEKQKISKYLINLLKLCELYN